MEAADEIAALEHRWRAEPGVTVALSLARLQLRLGDRDEARRWALRAAKLEPELKASLALLLQIGGSLVALPSGAGSVLCAVEDRSIVELAPLDVPARARSRIVAGHWLLALEEDGPLMRVDLRGGRRFERLATPIRSYCWAAVGGQLLLGGCDRDDGGLALMMGALDDEPPRWRSLSVPPEIDGYQKAVDALVVDGDRLIAFDNMILPQWIVSYEIGAGEVPLPASIQELPARYTYSRVMGAALGAESIVVFSRGGGQAGPAAVIQLLERDSLAEVGFLVALEQSDFLEDPSMVAVPRRSWHHLDIIGETVVVAAGRAGIGRMDLPSCVAAARHLRDEGRLWQGLAEQEWLEYQDQVLREDEEVLRVVDFGADDRFIAVLRGDEGYRWLVLGVAG